MCIAVPGKIARIFGSALLPMGTVDYGDTTRDCCLAYVPEAAVGDYVIVQTGFAIALLEPQEALQTLAAFHDIGVLPAPAETATPPARGETCTSWL
jgi:hydrogenase expression/formation protein HypC